MVEEDFVSHSPNMEHVHGIVIAFTRVIAMNVVLQMHVKAEPRNNDGGYVNTLGSSTSQLKFIGPTPYVMTIDPGLTTGIATLHPDESVRTYQFSVEELYEFVRSVDWQPVNVIVCEAYMISPDTIRKSRQLWSLEIIGMMRFMGWVTDTVFQLQQASAAKRFVTNDMLKAFGLYEPGRDHANDALRHLVLFLVQRKLISLP